MKTKRYIFVTNEKHEVVSFTGLVKKKIIWPRRNLAVPYLFWHHHLVKDVWMLEHATAVHPGVFTELTALEDLYLPHGDITLMEGCLPDHKVTVHVPCNEDCYTALMEYDWNTDNPSGTGFSSILWYAQKGKVRLHLTFEKDCCEVPELCWPVAVDITMNGKA